MNNQALGSVKQILIKLTNVSIEIALCMAN